MRIGVLGGTFDPPHIAHLLVAVDVRAARTLDRVLLVPAGDPWQKSADRVVTPGPIRLEMVAEAVRGLERIEACDIEVQRAGPSYTVDTLTELGRRHPGSRFEMILGTDAAARLDTWHRARELPDLAELVVVDRPGAVIATPSWWPVHRSPVHHVEVPSLEVSSTDIRERVRTGRPIDVLVPEAAIEIIRARRLYGGGTDD